MTPEYQRPPIKIALMGLGRAMFDEHYPVFKAHPALFKVVCACDLAKDRRDIVEKDFPECKMFRQYSDMLDERDIDVVDIATCTVDHVKHALASLQRGFWTLLESPMSITYEDALVLKGAATKARNRLIVMPRGMFATDYLLAKQVMGDPRLGIIHWLKIRKQDYVRRDDWQCVKRLGGGAAYYGMPDIMMQALKLMPTPPIQMWSDLKRVASLGDAEDFVHICLKTREQLSVELEFSGGVLNENRSPSFEIIAERGAFRVMPGANVGTLTMIDPDYKFPRRRSSVRTPGLADLHEDFKVLTEQVSLPKGMESGPSSFWKHVYNTVRTAAPFPVQLEDSMEVVKFAQLMKKNSPFGI